MISKLPKLKTLGLKKVPYKRYQNQTIQLTKTTPTPKIQNNITPKMSADSPNPFLSDTKNVEGPLVLVMCFNVKKNNNKWNWLAEIKSIVKVTKNDILYYFENYKKLPIGWDEKKIKKARKKIKKKKESDIGEKLKKGELGPFITEVMTIVNILRKDKLSGDELNDKIDSLLKTPSPSLSPSPESLGSLKGLDQDEIEMELIKRDRQDMVDDYYKNHPDEKRITLRSVSPVRNSSKGSK